ncbi:transcription termination/antitermination protein NusA [Candidatus Azambacteria bacterium]|nr:transcription termination/antitermination protein NusA [Candidatus Azambacteria bacterium]
MIDTKQFLSALNQIAEEKGIPKEKVIETIEMAIAAAYKKDYGERGQIIRAKLDADSGGVQMHQVKIAVDETMLKEPEDETVPAAEDTPKKTGAAEAEGEDEKTRKVIFNAERHIMIKDAKKINPDVNVGDELMFKLETHDSFGRIAAQTAKQVIVQRLREAERETVLAEYKSKEGEIVNGQVQRFEWKNVIFDLGKTSAVMYPEEQVQGERYRIGERMKVYVVRVDVTSKGPVVVISRSHPALIKKVFELEVPEIASGAVQIKAIAREAGARSKIAVHSTQEGVDPIGSCVGQKGTRVNAVISELSGEKIDIVEWFEDPAKFISHALSPAKVLSVELRADTKESRVIVPNDQLSLAIGKGGQNVRLAARLTGWKIDVRPAQEDAAPQAAEGKTQPEAAAEKPEEKEDK